MKTLKTSFVDMLRNDCIGELKAGLSRDVVREIMGEPETWAVVGGAKNESDSAIWKYNLLEYSFGGLEYIQLEIHSGDKLPENIQIEGEFPNSKMGLEDFKAFLEANEIEYSVDKMLSFGNQVTLKIGKQTANFNDGSLHSIYLR